MLSRTRLPAIEKNLDDDRMKVIRDTDDKSLTKKVKQENTDAIKSLESKIEELTNLNQQIKSFTKMRLLNQKIRKLFADIIKKDTLEKKPCGSIIIPKMFVKSEGSEGWKVF